MLGVDTDSVLNGSALNGLRGAGVGAVGRYYGRFGLTEANLIRSYGLDIFGVLETSGTSGYGGYQTGVNEMNAAIHGCRIAGGPTSGIVLWLGAYDFDARNPAAAQGYIDGAVATAHANGYLAGFYGPWGLALNTHGWDAWWQTMSTGFWGNGYTSAATISQRFPQPYFGGIQFDYDDIHNLARGGLWSTRAAPPPSPPAPKNQEDDEMLIHARLEPGEYTEIPLPIMVSAQVALCSDDSGRRGGLTGVPIRAYFGGPASVGGEGWNPLFKPSGDPGLGPDRGVAWFGGGAVYLASDGKGGQLVIENLDEAGRTREGIDPARFPAGNVLTVTVSYRLPPQ